MKRPDSLRSSYPTGLFINLQFGTFTPSCITE